MLPVPEPLPRQPERVLKQCVRGQVAAVLEYATNNAVEPFLEPVLELVNTILQRDALEVRTGMPDGVTAGACGRARALRACVLTKNIDS